MTRKRRSHERILIYRITWSIACGDGVKWKDESRKNSKDRGREWERMNLLSPYLPLFFFFFHSLALRHTPLSECLDQATVSFIVVVLFHLTGDFPGNESQYFSACWHTVSPNLEIWALALLCDFRKARVCMGTRRRPFRGIYAGYVGVRKNYWYVEWQWKVE